jgi:hypothetical protein
VNPFRISCTTCHARLKIVDPAAVGQILACPKCGSMVQAAPPAEWSPDGPAATDSVVLGSSTPILAAAISPGAKMKIAAGSGRAVPPPLPPRQPTAAATSNTAESSTATPALSSQIAAPVSAGARWFWPALSTAAVASLGIAALLIYLDHKSRTDPVVAVDTRSQPSQPAAERTPAPEASPPAAKSTDSSPVAKAPDAAPKPATNDPPAKVAAAPATDVTNNVKKPTDPPAAAVEKPADAPKPPLADAGQPTVRPVDPPSAVEAPTHIPPAKELPADKSAVPEIALSNAPIGRAVRPSVEKIPPRAVDVESHLTDPLAAVNYHATPLVQLLAELSQWSTIPISFDADALAELNVSPDVPVTLQLTETTIAGVLDEVLTPHGLSYCVVNHQLLIGRPRTANLRRVRYSISDLAGETAESNAQFGALVHAVVDPFAWKEAGGTATSRWVDGALVVEASESGHAQLLDFCEKLRIARGLPLRSKFDPARFRIEPRTVGAKAALAEPITVNYGRPESLARILNYLRGSTHLTLLVDQVALAEQRTSIETEGTLVADHQPLGQALTGLLEPMDLAWRVVGERTIEITTPQAAAHHGEIEFYPAGELLAGDASGAALVTRIQRELTASTQNDPAAARPAIHFDAASRMLIVSAPQSVQLRVASLLSGWRVARR